jgi:hypothetical protein
LDQCRNNPDIEIEQKAFNGDLVEGRKADPRFNEPRDFWGQIHEIATEAKGGNLRAQGQLQAHGIGDGQRRSWQ